MPYPPLPLPLPPLKSFSDDFSDDDGPKRRPSTRFISENQKA